MKTCLLCNTDAPDDTTTCPNDGEASWSTTAAGVATPVVVVEASDDDAPKRSRAPKASK